MSMFSNLLQVIGTTEMAGAKRGTIERVRKSTFTTKRK